MPRHEKIMTLSRHDFIRTLGQFASRHGFALSGSGDAQWRLLTPDGLARVSARAHPGLRRGALNLPRLAVTLDLSCLPPAAREGFLSAFETSFHRGGG